MEGGQNVLEFSIAILEGEKTTTQTIEFEPFIEIKPTSNALDLIVFFRVDIFQTFPQFKKIFPTNHSSRWLRQVQDEMFKRKTLVVKIRT